MTYIYRYNCPWSGAQVCKLHCLAQIPSLSQWLVEMFQLTSCSRVYQPSVHLSFHRKRHFTLCSHIRIFTQNSPVQEEDPQGKYCNVCYCLAEVSQNHPHSQALNKTSPHLERLKRITDLSCRSSSPSSAFSQVTTTTAKANTRYCFPPQGVKKQGTGMTERIH